MSKMLIYISQSDLLYNNVNGPIVLQCVFYN